VIYYPTVMARYSLFVLIVPLNPKQTNKQPILNPLIITFAKDDMFYSSFVGMFIYLFVSLVSIFT